MTLPRRLMAALSLLLALATGGFADVALGGAAQAQGLGFGLFEQPKYAAIVVDAKTGEVLYARRPDAQRYPASITKVMTLYLVFEALATGRLSPGERIVVSQHAANQSPSKLGLRAGETITVDDAIRAACVLSANDMAVALAERVGGGEDRFAQLMTLRAHELGMTNSRFYNANGLPKGRGGNISSARDIAILSRAVMRDYPQYYGYFSQRQFAYGGRVITNHNRLMLAMPGVDGIKTGYTAAAGFNLAASAVRDNRRLIAVVLGGSSTAARDDNVETLLNAGFSVMAQRSRGRNITLAGLIAEPDDVAGPVARPVVEQGSGEQPQLSVELADALAPSRTLPAPPVATFQTPAPRPQPTVVAAVKAAVAPRKVDAPAPPTKLLAANTAEDCAPTKTHGRHHRRRRHESAACAAAETAPVQVAKADAAPDCAKLHRHARRACERAARHAGESAPVQVAKADKTDDSVDCLKLRGSKRRACKREAAAAPVAVVAAAPEGDCARLHRRARRACERDTQVADASSTKAAAAKATGEGGHYLIQVGAYDSRKLAKDHLDKVTARYADVIASASGQVSAASGTYRVRFKGLSAADAKAACHHLSAKGERCMVMAAG